MDKKSFEQWIVRVNTGLIELQIEFEPFFKDKDLQDFYHLEIGEESHQLSIEILQRDKLPKNIADRMLEIVYTSKPDDAA